MPNYNLYLCMAFIRPILEYGDVVWGNCTKENSELLEKVQIEAARIITGLRVNSSRSILYSELGWETLQSRRDKHKLILFYKIIHGLAPQYLLDLIQPYFPTEHAYIILGLMAIFTLCHYVGLLLITIALFHLQLNYGIILMQK